MAKAFIGTSGFYYSSWIGDFYPKDIKKEDLLTYFQKEFSTVEINSSFYHIPLKKTVENWQSKVDKDFIFVFKASRTITHLKKYNVDQELVDTVLSPLSSFAAQKPKHLILFQTPGNLHFHPEKLEHIFNLLSKTFLYTFEFRHESWFCDETYEILKKNNAALVLSDSTIKADGSRLWPYHDVETAQFCYIRFHGSKRLYYSSYTDEELEEYAELIQKKLKKDIDVYCYFNNDAGGFATKNALKLRQFLGQRELSQ